MCRLLKIDVKSKQKSELKTTTFASFDTRVQKVVEIKRNASDEIERLLDKDDPFKLLK